MPAGPVLAILARLRADKPPANVLHGFYTDHVPYPDIPSIADSPSVQFRCL